MREFWPFHRSVAHLQSLHCGYEQAGLTVIDQPIPWSAEGVFVEALVRLPAGAVRRKSDFSLQFGRKSRGRRSSTSDVSVIAPEQMLRGEQEGMYRIRFSFSPPTSSTVAEVLYQERSLGQLHIRYHSREDFLAQLRLEMPTLAVRLGGETVACQRFVSGQSRGLVASVVLSSPATLVPLLSLSPHLTLRCDRTGAVVRAPIRLTSSQLTQTSALVAVVPRRFPRRVGGWSVRWVLGGRVLARQQIQGISQQTFERSLRIFDTRFVVQDGEAYQLRPQMPPLETGARVGPCFFVGSTEEGVAGRCQLQVRACLPITAQAPLLLEQEVVIGDGPNMVAPGTLDPADLTQVAGFELSVGGQVLGSCPLRRVPEATFTNEGGFVTPPEFVWSPAAEEEMAERLNRLLNG